MKQWEGIRDDTADTGNGCMSVTNAYYHLDGEIQRRYGLSIFAAQSGRTFRGFRSKTGQYFTVFVTDAGDVISVEA
jgi:hypothetical protein